LEKFQKTTKTMVKLQFDNNKQFKLTLPKALIDAKGWKKGDKIRVALDSTGNIVLKKEETDNTKENTVKEV